MREKELEVMDNSVWQNTAEAKSMIKEKSEHLFL